jgi:uncharacterized RDD family membrane protein YckC
MEQEILHNTQPAKFGRRLMASLYDWFLVLAIMMVASVPLVASSNDAISPGNALYRLALIAIATAFFTGFWSYAGQTLGMRAWRLKLTLPDGSAVNYRQALLRFACACVSAAPLGLGFFWVLFSQEKLSWHDHWSGTRLQLLAKNPAPKTAVSADDSSL